MKLAALAAGVTVAAVFHLARSGAGLQFLHSRGQWTVKPPWMMRAEAVWWLLNGNLRLARLFWRGA